MLGPLTGLPAIVLGFRGLRRLQDNSATTNIRPRLLTGIGTGLLGTLLVSGICYLAAVEALWPAVGRQVDRVFRDIEKERFSERYDGLWPTFRAIGPDSLYRAADKRWPRKNDDTIVRLVSGPVLALPSGGWIRRYELQGAAEPIIALGKPAVPHIIKWVSHQEWHVRYVAIYALKEITQQKTRAQYHDLIDPDEQQ